MNTKQREELKKKYPLIQVPNIDGIRQQTAKEIIEIIAKKHGTQCDMNLAIVDLFKEIKSKYGIGEK